MSERVNCKSCGVSTQRDLAEDRGGLCAVCWKKSKGIYHFELQKVPTPKKGKPKPPPKLTSKASKVSWGNISFLSNSIKNNMMRLGARPNPKDGNSPFENISFECSWDIKKEYQSSMKRYARLMVNRGNLEYKEHDDEHLQDDIPIFCYDFHFIDSDGFFENWEVEFTGTDRSKYAPLGSDGHHYFFLSQNESNKSDPLVSYVDHESLDEEPFNPDNLTLSMFIGVLDKS